MTLYQLGEEYLKQADEIKEMISGYSALRKEKSGVELFDLNTKISVLREMERDVRITGRCLVEYYSSKPTKKTYHRHSFN